MRHIEVDFHFFALLVAQEDGAAFIEHLLEVDGFGLEFRGSRENEDIAEQAVETFDFERHHIVNLELIVALGICLKHFVASADAGERIADFMGDFGREFAEQFEALAAGPIHFFQFLCGNIDDIIAIQLDGFVGRKPEPLDAEITGIAENRGMNGTIVCVEIDVFEILDDIIVGIADERFGTCVDIDDLVGFGIDNDDADGKRIEQDIVDAAINLGFSLDNPLIR